MNAHFIDVGQGDATLLEFSCGAVLIDTGGERTTDVNGTENVMRFLEAFFARRTDLNDTIDLLAITHPHIDHTRSIRNVLDTYTVVSAIDNNRRQGSGGAQQRHLQDRVQGDNIRYQGIAEGDVQLAVGLTNDIIDPIDCQGTDPEIRVLWGALGEDDGWNSGAFDNGNNHSLVIRVDFGDASFLFTGDLQEDAIDVLVYAFSGSSTLDVDIYQVGHHGSHNATTHGLMTAMTPDLAVISMGNSNLSHANHSAYSYGHPNDDMMRHLVDEQSGVSANRDQAMQVSVGERGACNRCNPRRPPIFNTWTVDRAVYGTGWSGTVTVSARSDGHITVQ